VYLVVFIPYILTAVIFIYSALQLQVCLINSVQFSRHLLHYRFSTYQFYQMPPSGCQTWTEVFEEKNTSANLVW